MINVYEAKIFNSIREWFKTGGVFQLLSQFFLLSFSLSISGPRPPPTFWSPEEENDITWCLFQSHKTGKCRNIKIKLDFGRAKSYMLENSHYRLQWNADNVINQKIPVGQATICYKLI